MLKKKLFKTTQCDDIKNDLRNHIEADEKIRFALRGTLGRMDYRSEQFLEESRRNHRYHSKRIQTLITNFNDLEKKCDDRITVLSKQLSAVDAMMVQNGVTVKQLTRFVNEGFDQVDDFMPRILKRLDMLESKTNNMCRRLDALEDSQKDCEARDQNDPEVPSDSCLKEYVADAVKDFVIVTDYSGAKSDCETTVHSVKNSMESDKLVIELNIANDELNRRCKDACEINNTLMLENETLRDSNKALTRKYKSISEWNDSLYKQNRVDLKAMDKLQAEKNTLTEKNKEQAKEIDNLTASIKSEVAINNNLRKNIKWFAKDREERELKLAHLSLENWCLKQENKTDKD